MDYRELNAITILDKYLISTLMNFLMGYMVLLSFRRLISAQATNKHECNQMIYTRHLSRHMAFEEALLQDPFTRELVEFLRDNPTISPLYFLVDGKLF